jgi:hypothetical protein
VSSLRATLNEMLPSPFPDAGDKSEIQLTAAEASHEQSDLAVRLRLTRPPLASTVGAEPNETSHLTSVAEETPESDAHPPVATAATTLSVATVERRQTQ